MALTVTRPALSATTSDIAVSNQRMRVRDITFDSSYATGGLALSPQQVGLRSKINQANVLSLAKTTSGTTAQGVAYDYTNGKLQAYNGDAGAAGPLGEVASTTNLSTFTVRMQFIGV